MSSYRLLIDSTIETLTIRTKNYKRLVILFITIGLITLCFVIGTKSLKPAASLFFLLPVYGVFLFIDNKVLNYWRERVVDAWKDKLVDLDALRQSLIVNKALPQQTLQGMLDTLPKAGDLVAEQTVSSNTRKALALLITARDKSQNRMLFCNLVSQILLAATFSWAVMANRWEVLFLVALIPLLHLTCKWQNRIKISKAADQTTKYLEFSDFDSEKYQEIASSLDWHGRKPGWKPGSENNFC